MAGKKDPNVIDAHVGGRVQLRRQEMNMSQGALGDGLGLTFQQVQKYEKGVNRIGASRLQQISEILQVPVSWFFEDVPHGKGRKSAIDQAAPSVRFLTDFVDSPEGFALAKAFGKIKDSKVRHHIVGLVKAIGAEAGD